MRLRPMTGLALAAVAAVALVGAPAASAGGGSITLTAVVQNGGLLSTAQFQYGTTTQYGSSTTSITLLPSLLPITVSATLDGLPDGTFHYRVVTSSGLFSTYGPDQTFTIQSQGSVNLGSGTVSSTTSATVGGTTVGIGATVGGGSTGSGTSQPPTTSTPPGPISGGSPPTAPAPTGPTGPGGASGQSPSPVTGTVPAPIYGSTEVIDNSSGSVLVRPPGARVAVPVQASATVPDGTLVDARRGVVAVSSALGPHGASQTVVAWGGSFRIRYDRSRAGRVDLRLAGGSFRACRRMAAHLAAGHSRRHGHHARRATHRRSHPASRSHRVIRSLWASDDHGRYTTQGNDSVATVRGTVWETQDRCDGTLTRVGRGVVAVRDRRSGRTFVVRAGHAHLAPRL